jgi:hypothetical protein
VQFCFLKTGVLLVGGDSDINCCSFCFLVFTVPALASSIAPWSLSKIRPSFVLAWECSQAGYDGDCWRIKGPVPYSHVFLFPYYSLVVVVTLGESPIASERAAAQIFNSGEIRIGGERTQQPSPLGFERGRTNLCHESFEVRINVIFRRIVFQASELRYSPLPVVAGTSGVGKSVMGLHHTAEGVRRARMSKARFGSSRGI